MALIWGTAGRGGGGYDGVQVELCQIQKLGEAVREPDNTHSNRNSITHTEPSKASAMPEYFNSKNTCATSSQNGFNEESNAIT